MGDHAEQRLQPLRRLCELVEALAIGADRRAEAGDDVGDITELLQDRVVGNGAHACRVAAIGGVLALPLHGPRAGLEKQVRPESAKHRAVAVMREKLLLEGAQSQEEIETEILFRVEWIDLGRRHFAVHHDRRERARRQGAVAEEHIAVAALEARFVLHGNFGCPEAPPRFVRHHVVKPLDKGCPDGRRGPSIRRASKRSSVSTPSSFALSTIAAKA